MKDKLIPKKLSRRQFLKQTGQGAALAGLLAACGAPSAEPAKEVNTVAPAAKAITLTFLAWPQAPGFVWNELAAKYMEQNPNVTIDVISIADPGTNHYPKLEAMIAAGTPPHLASFQGWEWQAFAEKGVLAPLNDYAASYNFTAPFPEGVAGIELSTKRDGVIYTVPMSLATMLMFYAKKPFDEAGIPYPTNDWTIEEFLEIAQMLTDTSSDFKKFGFQANGSWFRDIHWIRNTGKQEFDRLVDPKKSQFNQPEIVDIIQLFASDVYHKLKIAPTVLDQERETLTIDTGHTAMVYEGPWYFPFLNGPELREQGNQIEFDVVLMPKEADPGRPHRTITDNVGLLRSDNEEAAWDFLFFMADTEQAKRFSELTGRIPNTFDLMESFWLPAIEERFGVTNGSAFLEALVNSEIDVVSGVPRSKMWREIVKPIGYDPLVAGSATAAEVMPRVDAELQIVLDAYWASK